MGPDHHEPPRRFTDQTAQYLKKQGYGFGGDGKPDWKWTDPSVNELRVKQDGPGGQFLELKYLGSGSEDFYVASGLGRGSARHDHLRRRGHGRDQRLPN